MERLTDTVASAMDSFWLQYRSNPNGSQQVNC